MKNKKPEIRFKGFSEEWEEKELGEEIEVIGTGRSSFISNTRKSENTPYAVLGSTSIIGYDSEFDYSGDFILTARVGANAGEIYRHSGEVKISDNTVFLQCKNLDFVFFLLTKFNLKNLSFGTGQPLIKASELENLKLMFSCHNEQTQIGNFFKNLDSLITLHQRKSEKLGILKKAMLEKMFPKNGADVPEIRFKGFEGAWEERKLGEVVNLLTGHPFESKRFAEDGILLVRGMNVKRGYLDVSKNICEYWHSYHGLESYLLKENDIVIQMDGALIGKSYAKINGKNLPALLVQRVTRIRCEKVDCDFIYQYVQKDFLKYISTIKTETAIPHLSLNDIRNFQIKVPPNTEQEKIGNYFKNLDNLLTLHQGEIDKLKNLKKAMLEKMFV